MSITTCIFDAYGTLFDVNAAARQAAMEPGNEHLAANWQDLAKNWRSKQLQYTWLRALTGDHCDLWQITQDSLDWALEASALLDDTVLRARLLQLYWELRAYDEVPKMLETLQNNGMKTAILSNGSPDMLAGAVKSAGIETLLDATLSVEDVGIFKPAPAVYDMVGAHFGCDKSQVLFVSSNGWDACGAAGYGFNSVWVNRAKDPVDRLPAAPQHQRSTLTTIPELAAQL